MGRLEWDISWNFDMREKYRECTITARDLWASSFVSWTRVMEAKGLLDRYKRDACKNLTRRRDLYHKAFLLLFGVPPTKAQMDHGKK